MYHFMPKLSAEFALVLPPQAPNLPAYQWLYVALRDQILSGRLRAGTRLPSTRDLARQYGLARGTIINAFEQLKSEGYVEGSVGAGTYVNRVLPEKLLHVGHVSDLKPAGKAKRTRVLSNYGQRAKLFGGYENRPTRAFRANLPALDLFPMTLWTKITMRRLRRISTRHLMGCDPLGHMPLRQAITEYLSQSRGVRCVPEQVAVLSGVQEALDLTARLLVNRGDSVCVENPCYPGAVMGFEAYGATIHRTPVDHEGIAVQQLPGHGARLVYVTPGHQFPLGTTMSVARRLQLLEWARKRGALIFEDDYDSEYRYSGRPVPALQGFDERGIVLYGGSFSKVLFPALRLGYLVIPSDLLPRFEAVQSLTSRHAPMLEQLVLTEFIREGHFGRHIRRMREIYAERLSVLLEGARTRLAGLLEISNIEAGLQTMGWLTEGIDAESATIAAATRNVDVTHLGRYGHGRAIPEGLQVGFAALEPREIHRGIRELAIALEGERKRPCLPHNRS
jgi:GntR family transcriptional regulator / MocR family aminotransferase